MNAVEVFVYIASAGIIILIILISIAFFLLYRALQAAESFMKAAEGIVTDIQLIKTSTALTVFKFIRNIVHRIRGGGENYDRQQ